MYLRPDRTPGQKACFHLGEITVCAMFACETIDATTPLATLVELGQAGDRESLGEIVRRYEPTVYAVGAAPAGQR